MKTDIVATLAVLAAVSSARDVHSSGVTKREVPQEKSHNQFITGVKAALDLNNRFEIVDPVFALLGNAAAAEGAGQVTNLDCLQQIIADESFTNAKAANDLEGMTNALIFRALERNTGSVGQASVPCTETALNPEVGAIQQHQDPASDNADEINKVIELELATQLAAIGADPLLALKSATFAAGEIGDATGAGNTCDVADDEVGCIFTQNLDRPVATEEEIQAAVASAAAKVKTRAAGVNVQSFDGQLGGAAPPVIQSDSERPFEVNGATFLNAGAALQRSCAIQANACANAANSGQISGGTAQCNQQEQACNAAGSASVKKMRRGLYARQGLDFGSCSDPSIQFADGLDGRKEASFAPVNNADFNHGSANAVRIISDFICSSLGSKCDASADAVTACNAASSAAQAAQAAGQAGAEVAETFNTALGA